MNTSVTPSKSRTLHRQLPPPEVAPRVDLMGGCSRITASIDPHGFVALLDVMPRLMPQGQTADQAIVQAARVSYQAESKGIESDRQLIRHLLRHRHTSPFEMVEFKFHCRMPIFVARQWIRHRTANVNEMSGRYTELPADVWEPDEWRGQGQANKQGSEGVVEYVDARVFYDPADKDTGWYNNVTEATVAEYRRRLAAGVSKELARTCLTLATYTEWYWKIDLHNLLHFLGLRMDEHAQKEIRDYADAMFQMIQPLAPATCEAFLDYHPNMGGVLLSRLEAKALRAGKPQEVGEPNSIGQMQEVMVYPPLEGVSKGEAAEWEAKKKRLGLLP